MITKTTKHLKRISRKQIELDAKGQVLGRLATKIASLLMGKHKPNYSTHLDVGDIVKIKNVDKVVLTGKKKQQKIYYRHTGWIGHLKATPAKALLERNPQRMIHLAVKRMLPKNKLQKKRLKRLIIEK